MRVPGLLKLPFANLPWFRPARYMGGCRRRVGITATTAHQQLHVTVQDRHGRAMHIAWAKEQSLSTVQAAVVAAAPAAVAPQSVQGPQTSNKATKTLLR